MTERIHPQDLRAIVASLLAPATNYAGVHWKAHGIKCADEMLAELERTAKPEAPAPVKVPGVPTWPKAPVTWDCDCGLKVPHLLCKPKAEAPTRYSSEVDETAPEPDAEDHKKQLKHLTMEFQLALGNGCDEQAWQPGEHWALAVKRGLAERYSLRADVDRLKAELAEAEAKERERIIALLLRHSPEAFSTQGSGMDWPEWRKDVLRAALEPKPEVPRG